MGQPTYTFDHSIAASVGDTMISVTQQIQTELNDLDTQVKSNLANWSDDARDQYAIAKANWDNAALRMHTNLKFAVEGLAQIAGEYLNVTKSGVATWDGFSVK